MTNIIVQQFHQYAYKFNLNVHNTRRQQGSLFVQFARFTLLLYAGQIINEQSTD